MWSLVKKWDTNGSHGGTEREEETGWRETETEKEALSCSLPYKTTHILIVVISRNAVSGNFLNT